MLNSVSKSVQVAKLRPFVPQFYGTLRLEGKVDGKGGIETEGIVDDVPEVRIRSPLHLLLPLTRSQRVNYS
jgi:hypothetical protein